MAGIGNKVEKVVKTRTSTQARSHAQKVLAHPNSGEGISTSATNTKNSPISNKAGYFLDFKKSSSVCSDENSSEFAIFKVEKVRRPLPGRSRVNSENNVFSIPVDELGLDQESIAKTKTWNRKCSMNIDYSQPKIDLWSSPIKETIKEHKFEDDEEEKEAHQIREFNPQVEPQFFRRNTLDPKATWALGEDRLFLFDDEKEEMNLDNDPSDIHMDISNGPTSKFYSLDPQEEELGGPRNDVRMEYESDFHYSLKF